MNKYSKIAIIFFILIAITSFIAACYFTYEHLTSNYHEITGEVIDGTCQNEFKNKQCKVRVSYKVNNKKYNKNVKLNRETINVKTGDSIKLKVQKSNHNNVEIYDKTFFENNMLLCAYACTAISIATAVFIWHYSNDAKAKIPITT
jgi:hypothetical protein